VSGALDSWEGHPSGEPDDARPLVGQVASMRGLVAERRLELPMGGPDASAYGGILDGLGLATAAAGELQSAARPHPAGLAGHLRPDIDSVTVRIGALCAALTAALSDPAGGRDGVAGAATALETADAELRDALEAMRAKHVTPGADAAELLDLFGVVNALLVVCQGLRRAAAGAYPAR
jgi:hypothetical protein